MKLNNLFYLGISIIILSSCSSDKSKWTYDSTIDLGKTTPIGLTILDDHIWVADGDNNQLVHLSIDGKVLFTEEGFDRPMHITTDGESVFIPEYGRDQITAFKGEQRQALLLTDSLDAPAGIHYANGKFAIADFYNHRILYGSDNSWISFGTEGKAEGEFYYPTDVHIFKDRIYVADAYNNRVQVFTLDGGFVSSFGKEEKINAATGIFVSEQEVFVTDFENDRVLIYSLDGMLNQIIEADLDKPTDILLNKDILYIANYKGKNLMTFVQAG